MSILSVITNRLAGLDTVPTEWTLGVDVSHWQGTVDWQLMRSRNVRFAFYKLSDFVRGRPEGFIDRQAETNWRATKEAGIINGCYHWLQPAVAPQLQAGYFLDAYARYPTDLPPVLDFEDRQVSTWSDMLWRAQVWLEIVERETGRIPIVYTSPGYMAFFNRRQTGFLSRYPLWVAHYIQRRKPNIPYPWGDWAFWQYSDKADFPFRVHGGGGGDGRNWGVQSRGLSHNWYQGDVESLVRNFGASPLPPQPQAPQPEMTKPAPENEAETVPVLTVVRLVNIRSQPRATAPVLGQRRVGDSVNVLDLNVESSRRVWVRDVRGWSAVVYDGTAFMSQS